MVARSCVIKLVLKNWVASWSYRPPAHFLLTGPVALSTSFIFFLLLCHPSLPVNEDCPHFCLYLLLLPPIAQMVNPGPTFETQNLTIPSQPFIIYGSICPQDQHPQPCSHIREQRNSNIQVNNWREWRTASRKEAMFKFGDFSYIHRSEERCFRRNYRK